MYNDGAECVSRDMICTNPVVNVDVGEFFRKESGMLILLVFSARVGEFLFFLAFRILFIHSLYQFALRGALT